MMNRMTLFDVIFARPVTRSGIEGTRSAGTYAIEIQEEQLQGLSFLACRRLRTAILIPPEHGSMVVAQSVLIDQSELDAAIRKANAEPEEASG
jgi:hypothetical protein